MKEHFKPEFLNRIDDTVLFSPLTREAIGKIVRLQAEAIEKRMGDLDMKLVITPEALGFIADEAYTPEFGARPVQRYLQKNVETQVAKHVLGGEVGQGDTIMESCEKWGIDVFIHYSFPRHMAMELIVGRHNLLKQNADALGIEMVDVTAPDPTAEAGLSASQQFILEDVPQQLAKYEGKKVAFFTTNCGMQPSLQAACLDEPNAYYPSPCCPSPYHAFPATLGLELAIGGDDQEALHQIALKLKEHNAIDRFSTWASPVAMTIIAVGVEYAKQYAEGTITSKNDSDALKALLNEKVEGAKIDFYTNDEGTTFDNYYTILLAPVDFNDYL